MGSRVRRLPAMFVVALVAATLAVPLAPKPATATTIGCDPATWPAVDHSTGFYYDISGADLSGCTIATDRFLQNVKAVGTRFDNLHAHGLGIYGGNYLGATFRNADLGPDATRNVASWFTYAQLRDVDFTGAYFGGTKIDHSDLGGADFTGSDFPSILWGYGNSCPDGFTPLGSGTTEPCTNRMSFVRISGSSAKPVTPGSTKLTLSVSGLTYHQVTVTGKAGNPSTGAMPTAIIATGQSPLSGEIGSTTVDPSTGTWTWQYTTSTPVSGTIQLSPVGISATDSFSLDVQSGAPRVHDDFIYKTTFTESEAYEGVAIWPGFWVPMTFPGQQWRVLLDWGDGSANEQFIVDQPGDFGKLSHRFTAPVLAPSYTVTVTVTEVGYEALSGSLSYDFTIRNQVAVSVLSATVRAGSSDPILFSIYDPGDDGPWALSVSWGDGTASSATVVDKAQAQAFVHPAYTVGSWQARVTVTDAVGAEASAGFTVDVIQESPTPPAPGLAVIAGPGFTAGVPAPATVVALDSNGLNSAYTGTVHFTSSDVAAVLPADYTFTSADHGAHTFPVTLKTAGTRSITVSDTLIPSLSGAQSVVVGPGAAASFVVVAPTTWTAGTPQKVTVSLKDACGNPVTSGYGWTAYFSSSDPAAVLPANHTYLPGDGATYDFDVTLRTAGPQTISVAEVYARVAAGSSAVTVRPTAASSLLVTTATSFTAGGSHTLYVTAKDAFGNKATGYAGTIHFGSTDPAALLPADYRFTTADRGVHAFSVTLKTAGTRSITATDTANASITGSQSGIAVGPGAVRTLLVTTTTSWVAGVSHSVYVTAKDSSGNTVPAYRGTIHFTSTDARAVLPADYTFTYADHGVHTFSVALKTAGSQSVTATDRAGLTGSQNGINVTAASAKTLTVSAPASWAQGTEQTVTVTARDAYGNVATGYRGQIRFSSSDALAVKPENYTFGPGDAGVHTFAVTLNTAGTQSIGATDVANATIAGTATGILVS